MDDYNEICEFIDKNSFALLVSTNEGKLNSTHIPVLLKKDAGRYGTLYCHIAKANQQWKDIDEEVLVVFSGPHHYISSSWYETDQSVPTWNYLAVHAYGNLSIIENKEEKIRIIKELTEYFESKDSKYKISGLKQNYFDGLLNGIVAFKIEITKLEGKKKLSQNHSLERQKRVINELDKINDNDAGEISELMKKNLKE